MLINAKELLKKAQQKKLAIPAFNVSSLEGVQAVFIAANQTNSPVILETSEGEAKHMMPEVLVGICKSLEKIFPVDYVIHLDRAKDITFIEKCLQAGYNSFACEFGSENYEDNVRDTLQAIKVARRFNAQVEGAVEVVPLRYYKSSFQKEMIITSPEISKQYVHDTGVDSFVVSIGTQSGRLKTDEKIKFEVLAEINAVLPGLPLVLHGGSFLSEEIIRKAINNGIAKINVNSENRIAYTEQLKKNIKNNHDEYAPYRLLAGVREAMIDIMVKKIKLFNNKQ